MNQSIPDFHEQTTSYDAHQWLSVIICIIATTATTTVATASGQLDYVDHHKSFSIKNIQNMNEKN